MNLIGMFTSFGNCAGQAIAVPAYYPTNTELRMLRTHAAAAAQQIPAGAVVVELGCATAVKTPIILNALLDR